MVMKRSPVFLCFGRHVFCDELVTFYHKVLTFAPFAGAVRYGKPLVLDCSEVALNWHDLSKVQSPQPLLIFAITQQLFLRTINNPCTISSHFTRAH